MMPAVPLTRDDLVAIAPPPKHGPQRAIWQGYCDALTSRDGAALLAAYGVTTPLRLAHLLATFAAETGLALMWESGAYSAEAILRVFGPGRHSAAIGAAEAKRIAALPVAERTQVLFERVYGAGNPKKARALGNTEPGDGWRFRGLGLIQLTGRAAHAAAAAEIGCAIEDLNTPMRSVHAALIEWDEKDCNRWADRDDAVSIRKLINGGSLRVPVSRLNGLPAAMAAVRRAKAALADTDPVNVADALAGSDAKPASLLASTEAHASVATAGVGGMSLYDALAAAAAKTAEGGTVSVQAFVLHMMSSPTFWLSALTVATGLYLYVKRAKRFHIFGV